MPNANPYWLGTVPVTLTSNTNVNAPGIPQITNTFNSQVTQLQPTYVVSTFSGGLAINSITSNTPSTFSTIMLSTGTYWIYADIAAEKGSRQWLTGDSVQFWTSDSNVFAANSAPMWPDYAGKPYYQGYVAGGPDSGGQGTLSATYSGWLALTSNSKVYSGVVLNTSASGSLPNKFDLYNFSYQRIA